MNVLILAFQVVITLGAWRLLHRINRRTHHMSAILDRLTTEVTETRDLAASAVALITGLAQQIRDNAEDPEALEALADELDASNASLAAALTANTPAPTEPPVAPDAPADEPQA